MLHFILTWLGAAIALIITSRFVPGFNVDSFTAALIGAAIMGLVNAIVRPILILLTLPLTIVTLGLFLLVINAIAFCLVVAFTPGLSITGFFAALIASIVLTIVSTLISLVLRIFD
ncbi:phage holin family protein [Kovacikia minuta CCNUW1]|uniref:phage holin family protein n=1 Tax=Kovacikia minuta TaxID=2931930 RepID=UPI001CCEFB12|nr:phage holin family protein [Kovacikia minuta]UBF25958.1 phage holin family protein [Kovacikia minuta CCNUW1]